MPLLRVTDCPRQAEHNVISKGNTMRWSRATQCCASGRHIVRIKGNTILHQGQQNVCINIKGYQMLFSRATQCPYYGQQIILNQGTVPNHLISDNKMSLSMETR